MKNLPKQVCIKPDSVRPCSYKQSDNGCKYTSCSYNIQIDNLSVNARQVLQAKGVIK